MKSLGYLLITAGFLAGSFFTVKDAEAVALGPFLGSLLVGALGVAIVRLEIRKAATHEEKLSTDIKTLGTTLGRLAENVATFDNDKDTIDVYDLRHQVEKRFADDIAAFVDARESIAHTWGLEAYAEVMSHFASGERHLNRVWSASTDGYVDEAHTYVGKAALQFREARDAFYKLAA